MDEDFAFTFVISLHFHCSGSKRWLYNFYYKEFGNSFLDCHVMNETLSQRVHGCWKRAWPLSWRAQSLVCKLWAIPWLPLRILQVPIVASITQSYGTVFTVTVSFSQICLCSWAQLKVPNVILECCCLQRNTIRERPLLKGAAALPRPEAGAPVCPAEASMPAQGSDTLDWDLLRMRHP